MSLSYKDMEETFRREAETINSLEELEAFRLKYLGRKGIIGAEFARIASLPVQERVHAGRELNSFKKEALSIVESKKAVLTAHSSLKKEDKIDITLPGIAHEIGKIHPITQVIEEICRIFCALGFKVYEGPEIESEYNNFQALNIPLEHPSRDAFDTFYIAPQVTGCTPHAKNKKREKTCGLQPATCSSKLLLRSHTSPGQIRVMEKYKPPLAVIVPGKVYRPDATDASHSYMFHQVEGFFVDKDVRFSDLKGVLESFAAEMFGPSIEMRFRPHFFPFTEPSAEVDISCIICRGRRSHPFRDKHSDQDRKKQKSCSVCKGKGWLEILGCGMIHPNVFKHVGYSSKKFTGFAFGMGVERIAMLKHGVKDIRMFFENDLRFLKQF